MGPYQIAPSSHKKGQYGIVGHVGVGHVHSHSGYVQDDSAGFAAATHILKQAFSMDTLISGVEMDLTRGSITVTTKGGGSARAFPRRGITPAEADILSQRAPGMDAAFPQAAALHVFGRIYGQGAAETACAFEGACALAVANSFQRTYPSVFHTMTISPPGTRDTAIAAVIDVDTIPVAVMLVINYTEGGIGPDEDYEGNTRWGDKGRVMCAVGLDSVPTIILESKAYNPVISQTLVSDTLLIRAQHGIDHTILAQELYQAAEKAKIRCLLRDDLMPYTPGSLKAQTREFAHRIIQQAELLADAERSSEKVRILAELNRLVSEDAGGVTFMSNYVHDTSRSAGVLPGISVVLSSVISSKSYTENPIPVFTIQDAEMYQHITLGGILSLHNHR